MKDRFAKLAALTRGAAVLSLSVGAGGATGAIAGCTKNEPPPPPVASGTIQPDPAGNSSDAGALPRRKFPMPNAMRPGRNLDLPPAQGGGSPEGGATTTTP
jgi:hypothetical protein